MKNKLVYDDKKIMLCSILILICSITEFMYSFGYYIANDYYLSFEDFWGYLLIALLYSLLRFMPELICVAAFVYNRFKPANAIAANKLFKIYTLIYTLTKLLTALVYCFSALNRAGTLDAYFYISVLSTVFWLLLVLFSDNKKIYSVSRVAVLIMECLYAVMYLYNLLEKLIAGSFESLSSTAIIMNLIFYAFTIAQTYILLFGVFKREPSADELLEKLNKSYTSGKISKEDYDAQRQKIIDSI